MKTAIVGSSGYISNYIIKKFIEDSDVDSILRIDKNTEADVYLDLAKPEGFQYDILTGIDYIVFTAAISGPDKCASDFDDCWKINVIGTSYFINEALKRNCRVLFFSSDAVFGDIPAKIYDEESATYATTSYGKMKKAVEDEFKDNGRFKAIRLSYVASARDRFVSYCLKCVKNNEIAEIYHPFYRNVITVSDVVQVVLYFAKKWNDYPAAFLNVAGKELVSRVRIADELNRFFEGKLKYCITIPDGDFFVNRPRITQMRSLYLQKYNILPDETFTEKIGKELRGVAV